MMDTPKLSTPRLTVVMDDGAVLTVQILNIDMLTWDRTRAIRKWPAGSDAPFVWMTFLAWHALKREQQIPDLKLEDFEQRCQSVTSDEATADDVVDPTNQDPAGG